jgi:hypothetical protein
MASLSKLHSAKNANPTAKASAGDRMDSAGGDIL